MVCFTRGELGKPQNSPLTPIEQGNIREQEGKRLMAVLKASLTLLSFPDAHLPFIPFEELVAAVLPTVYEVQPDGFFAVHPNEITPKVDHLDHTTVGSVARYIGAAADVRGILPNHPELQKYAPLKKRPELYLWTSNNALANSYLVLDEATRKQRNEYLGQFYPSQFPPERALEWQPIFDSFTYDPNSQQHRERYLKVR